MYHMNMGRQSETCLVKLRHRCNWQGLGALSIKFTQNQTSVSADSTHRVNSAERHVYLLSFSKFNVNVSYDEHAYMYMTQTDSALASSNVPAYQA